jgi:chromosome segregation ATPase
MARAGLGKEEVKRARDALIAGGRHPSLDAVRIALGNTGSKSTIHKFLKELEADEGGGGKPSTLSEELQELVARLAERLQSEADAIVAEARKGCAEEVRRQEDFAEGLRLELASSRERERSLQQRLSVESEAHNHSKEQLMAVRLESAGQGREIKLLEKELRRVQGLYEQLLEEKITWRHERAQLEEMLSHREQD